MGAAGGREATGKGDKSGRERAGAAVGGRRVGGGGESGKKQRNAKGGCRKEPKRNNERNAVSMITGEDKGRVKVPRNERVAGEGRGGEGVKRRRGGGSKDQERGGQSGK